MHIKKTTWLIFLILATISFGIWFKYSYPQLAFVDFSVKRQQALEIAKKHLKDAQYDVDDYRIAIAFHRESQANRYLQRTIGFKEFRKFTKEQDFDLFFWLIRFFKENEQEEFRLTISSATGQVVGFNHAIKETAFRETISRDEAKEKAINFLKSNFKFDFKEYIIQGESSGKKDNRSDHSFSWKKINIAIPWSNEENSGTGKLYTGARISGDEILSFYKHSFSIPSDFNRNQSKQHEVSRNILTVVNLLYIILFVSSIFFLIVRKNHLVMHTTKKFYFGIMAFFFLLIVAQSFNHFEKLLFNYQTTADLQAYFSRFFINMLKAALFASIAIVIPSLSGELLHYETSKENKKGSFLHYMRSTFLSRSLSQSIFLGYIVCVILLGMQSLITEIGKNYWNVWTEHNLMTDLSTAYVPILTAFAIGFKASFMEEIMYRLFAINFFKKIFKSPLIAVILSSVLWGFSHTSYPVFPMWFRGLEVTLIGFFLGFVYLRFGIVTVIVAHYLFNAFWGSAGYLIGTTQVEYFYSALIVLLIPFLFAVISWIANKEVSQQKMTWNLNKHQKFNLDLLKSFLKQNESKFEQKDKISLKKEICSHGWDIAVVEMALEETNNKSKDAD